MLAGIIEDHGFLLLYEVSGVWNQRIMEKNRGLPPINLSIESSSSGRVYGS